MLAPRNSDLLSLVLESFQFVDIRYLDTCWRRTFGTYSVKMILETITASRVCGYSMIH